VHEDFNSGDRERDTVPAASVEAHAEQEQNGASDVVHGEGWYAKGQK
jgi:hypothetical protein